MKTKRNMQEISTAVGEIESFLTKHNITSRDVVCCRLLMEEVILAYQEKVGCEHFELELTKKSGKVIAALSFQGSSYDIFSDEEDIIVQNLLKRLFSRNNWEYKNGVNRVVCEFDAARSLLNNLLYLGKFISAEKMRFGIACALQLVVVLLCVVVPILSARLISNYILNDITAVLTSIIVLFAVNAISDYIKYCANRLHNAAYNQILKSIEMELSQTLMEMDVDCIEKHGSGMIIQRMTSDTIAVTRGAETVMTLISDFVNYVGILIAICLMSPMLFGVKALGLIMLISIQLRKTECHNANDRSYRVQNDHFTSLVGEMVRGSKDIKLLNSEQHFEDELERVITQTTDSHLHLWNTSQNYTLLSNELGKVMELCFYLLLALFITRGSLRPSDAVILFNYSNGLINMPLFIGNCMTFFRGIGLSSERLYQLVNSREFTCETFGEDHLDTVEGEIKFQDVFFAYNANDPSGKQKKVLKGLNLTIHPGEMVAFVGESGCGKTTSLNLISKLYEPTKGAVLLDGVNIKTLDKETIRSNITAVSQNAYVFNMSIRDNLRIVCPELTDEEMIRVCKAACIHDDIMSFSDGYDTIVGESGVMMSGGQRQRLTLARSMLNDYKIILFDEATSALDNCTQSFIQETINQFRGKKTVVIVAHRLSTIKDCDRIFYFSEGRVLAEGSHAELMRTCPEYQRLYMSE